jgi:hypothetical protein
LIKNIEENLSIQPKHFWKYISPLKKNDLSVTQHGIGAKIITEAQFIAEALADHFPSILVLHVL